MKPGGRTPRAGLTPGGRTPQALRTEGYSPDRASAPDPGPYSGEQRDDARHHERARPDTVGVDPRAAEDLDAELGVDDRRHHGHHAQHGQHVQEDADPDGSHRRGAG